MIHPNASDTFTVRSVFVIGPDKKLKLTLTYPASTGRNFDELLRVIDSLQLTAKHKVATPSDWKQGEDVIIVPSVSDDDAKALFPSGWKTVQAVPARRPAAEVASGSETQPVGAALRVDASSGPAVTAWLTTKSHRCCRKSEENGSSVRAHG